jgi:hypothetical protein
VIASAEEALEELLCELEEACAVSLDFACTSSMHLPSDGDSLRRRVVNAAYRAKVRLDKLRLGVVAA